MLQIVGGPDLLFNDTLLDEYYSEVCTFLIEEYFLAIKIN